MNGNKNSSPLILPEYIKPCPMCKGEGLYEQTYTVGCGGGYYRDLGRCDLCDGWRYVYKIGGDKVSESILNQISVINGLSEPLKRVLF